ncbi:hypothetical protein CC85DRAFT_31956 [Cutaneotrichosporon oleaginosum]|uniref:Uncharacterized protein n=1 Tax=Cutaneotrichosporon oleaginosum TaxID=879819 RepID=A0A0J1B8L6_9TREE|nr:uncharacterized protein CC85DRAFT_31956 [Cutaneotrichosporon oleaginosum]KLT44129.1 hypothetical protein CC85DRAFT_31956 [Cutaneotrichosporon oleaginosum]TXT09416.1 hypothetical protein COLE_03350 [Cutaneotrichosporon oleaginosum]
MDEEGGVEGLPQGGGRATEGQQRGNGRLRRGVKMQGLTDRSTDGRSGRRTCPTQPHARSIARRRPSLDPACRCSPPLPLRPSFPAPRLPPSFCAYLLVAPCCHSPRSPSESVTRCNGSIARVTGTHHDRSCAQPSQPTQGLARGSHHSSAWASPALWPLERARIFGRHSCSRPKWWATRRNDGGHGWELFEQSRAVAHGAWRAEKALMV